MAAAASLVVIMGTQYFDGSGATGGQDYPVTDLLQMMFFSRARAPTRTRAAGARPALRTSSHILRKACRRLCTEGLARQDA